MKNLGTISEELDIATKHYVDDALAGNITPGTTDTFSLGTASLRYLAAYIKTLNVATLSSAGGSINLNDTAPYNYYLGVNGNATKLASLTSTSLTVNGLASVTDGTDYSVSEGVVSAALKVTGGVHIGKQLHIAGKTWMDSRLTINNNSAIWFKDSNGTAFHAFTLNATNTLLIGYGNDSSRPNYLTSIQGSDIYLIHKYTPDGSTAATATYGVSIVRNTVSSTTAVRVGILTGSPQYPFHVVGESYLGGKVNLGGTTYYLGNGAAASKLYSLTVGSSTALSVSASGVVSIANTTEFASASSAALKVSGGVYIAKNLAVYGKRIYFDATHYLELDANDCLHTNVGLYSDSFITAYGVNGGSGGGSGSSVNVCDYASVQAGTATGVASENNAYVPTAYAMRQTYLLANGALPNTGGTVTGNVTLSGTGTTQRYLAVGNGYGAVVVKASYVSSAFEGGLVDYNNNSPKNIITTNGSTITVGNSSDSLNLIGAATIKESTSSTTGQIVLTAGSSPSITVGGYNFLSITGSGSTLAGNLGSSSIKTVIQGSSVTVNAALSVAGSILPSSTGSYNLGSSSLRFERGYIRYVDTPSGFNLRFCIGGTEAMNICSSSTKLGNVYIGGSSDASYKLQVNGTFYASGAASLGSSLSTSGDISTSGDVVITKTANNPAVTFKGEYDNNLGANITLGSITGNKETISSVTYTGVKVSSDFFIPNGKHIYTYNYNGVPRSIAYYATANYDYLQLGDSAGVTNIKGSAVQINDSALGNAAFKGVATSISSSSTDANLATAKAVYTYVENNCVTSSALENYVLSSALGTAAYKGTVTSILSTSTDNSLATGKAVYDCCKHRFYKEYSSIDNSSKTSDTWWRLGSIATPYSSLEFCIGNGYNNVESGYVYFNISQGYWNTGAKIGQELYIITQTGGYNKCVKAIRLVYSSTNRGSGKTTAYVEVLIAKGSTCGLKCECSTMNQTFSWLSTPTLGVIGATSASSSYTATTLYVTKGLSTTGGYNCTWLFNLSANSSIVQTETTVANFIVEDLLNAIATGNPYMYVTSTSTINGVSYNTRTTVHVGTRGTSSILLYYFSSPNSQSVDMNCIEIGYSSGWKVTAKYTKAL